MTLNVSRFRRDSLRFQSCVALLVTACVVSGVRADNLPATTALDDWVRKPDPSYRWSRVASQSVGGVTYSVLDMTSQTWRTKEEVDRTEWRHWVTVIRPDGCKADTGLLLIGGGSNKKGPPSSPDDAAIALARGTGTVVAELRMVPNQPLIFAGDGRERYEDDLIAYTWNKYMDTGDPTWVARMPMVKSAVRAMDAIQEFVGSDQGGGQELRHFVVAGGSKRGWTTWLTGAVDPRVRAIVPIVIDVVNVIPSMEHHFAAYGFWAPAVGDYERSGIMDRRFQPAYERLIRLVDPYFYRHRLTMPKFVVNASGDEFFLPDSSRFYFDDLLGEKLIRYVPNTRHSLSESDAVESIGAFVHTIVHGGKRPEYEWKFVGGDGIQVTSEDAPKSVRLWQAVNTEARDFRLQTIGKAYTSSVVDRAADGKWLARVEVPDRGFRAFFVELEFDVGAPVTLKVSSAVRVVPDVLPHRDRLEARNAELKKRAVSGGG